MALRSFECAAIAVVAGSRSGMNAISIFYR